jgi:two-component system sensor histidine kinase KdpD
VVIEIVFRSLEDAAPLLQDRLVRTEIAEGLPMADCDETMINRVLKLLLDNAAKYSPSSSPVTVSGRSAGGSIVISVATSGPTLTQNECECVFDKYYRGSNARSSGIPGTGLGLASARSIVEAHGGKIWVLSEADRGNAFQFSLPVAEGDI